MVSTLCFGLGFQHLKFWQETFWHRHFITRTFQQEDISAQEHFCMGIIQHKDVTSQGHYSTGTFQHKDISAHWCFSTCTFWHCAKHYRHFGIYISAWLPLCQNVHVPKYPCPKMSQWCCNVPVPKRSLCWKIPMPKCSCVKMFSCRKVTMMKCPCQNVSCRNVRCRNKPKPCFFLSLKL